MGKLTPSQYARRKWILKMRVWLGLCRFCGADIDSHSKICKRCQGRKIERQAEIRAEAKARGLCRECKKVSVEAGQYYCDDCNGKRWGVFMCGADGCVKVATRRRTYCDECKAVRDKCKNGLSCDLYFPICAVCSEPFTSRYINSRLCSDACIKVENAIRNKAHYDPIPRFEIVCGKCGDRYNSSSMDRDCCPKCIRVIGKASKNRRRRARMKGASCIERVDLGVLFERDGGRCMICKRKLNTKRIVPHRLAATVDHIIPLAEGGEHSYKNTQLACFKCNYTKSNGVVDGGEQLRLYG